MFTVGPAGTYANEITPVLTTYDDYDDGSYTAGGDDYDYYDELADRSYAFGYSGGVGDQREEEANSEGYVRGSYSYLNNEGNQIKVEYVAGKQIGRTYCTK